MSNITVKKNIADAFIDIADLLKTGKNLKKPVIGIFAENGEHGKEIYEEAVKSAEIKGYKAINYVCDESEDIHKIMEEKLEKGEIDGAITMHYSFPIGVSTVGRVVTPGEGRKMFLANTTGTSDTERNVAMVKNALYGIIAAKACGISNPSVGIANIDGARQTERALKKLDENGYKINFADSARADGGVVMRGNDLLLGTSDVMVMDSLTGNLIMKMLSSFSSGGSYETTGYGYGPGIGENYNKLIMIISRASGVPVVEGAIEYASILIQNEWYSVVCNELKLARKAGLNNIIKDLAKSTIEKELGVTAPTKEIVTAQIPGIEVMDLENAVQILWKQNIYAESGMGCIGPIIRVNEEKFINAKQILADKGYIS
ncbi:MAG: glycine reductase [Peptostreptococcaceae bacterium]|nr:glycine reductase [Peptostreptococcaceae bacterium]